MNYQAHRVGGVCATTMVATYFYQDTLAQPEVMLAIGLMTVGGVVGALLPDIDHPTSKISKRIPLIPRLINGIFGHRGFTHSILANLLLIYMLFLATELIPSTFLGYYLPVALGLSVGYFSHLVLDMLTIKGIPLFYPFSKKNINLARFRTGRDDLLVSLLLIVSTGIYLYFLKVI